MLPECNTRLRVLLATLSLSGGIAAPPLLAQRTIGVSIQGRGQEHFTAGSTVAAFEPLQLTFELTPTDTDATPLVVYRLDYLLFVDDKTCPPAASAADDGIWNQFGMDLYGTTAPGTYEVDARIIVPAGKFLTVCARVMYEAGANVLDNVSLAQATALLTIDTPKANGIYWRYKDGYARSHLLASGRGLTETVMKEYRPGEDPVELLYHSSTQRYPDSSGKLGPMHYYVPWIKVPGVDNGEASRLPNGVVFGGDENPLLRSGLAMAVLSKEWSVSANEQSLRSAASILRFFEDSELKIAGQGSGFFLRHRSVGESRPRGKQFFASTDELLGVTLGLLNLWSAIAVRPPPDGPSYADLKPRIQGLVDRLATNLSSHSYFIVPPPGFAQQERQLGWSGTYMYEWYFRRAFNFIVGHDYPPPPRPSIGVPLFFLLPWGRPGATDDLGTVTLLFLAGNSALDRAKLGVQGVGVMRLLQDVSSCPGTTQVGAFLGRTIGGAPPYWLPGIPVEVPIFAFMLQAPNLNISGGYFNVALVLHALQLALIPGTAVGDVGELTEIRALAKSFLENLLEPGIQDLSELAANSPLETFGVASLEALAAGPALAAVGAVPTGRLKMALGGCSADQNYYAAAVYRRFINPSAFGDVATFTVSNWQSDGLPVGNIIASDSSPVTTVVQEHNPPPHKLGSGVSFESDPNGRAMGSRTAPGVTEQMIGCSRWCKHLDLLRQGAGLDLLLPASMNLGSPSGSSVLDGHLDNASARPADVPRQMAGCAPNPQSPSTSTEADDALQISCEYPWSIDPPEGADLPDRFGGPFFYPSAACPCQAVCPCQCGGTQKGVIGRSTLYSRNGRTRQAPYPIRYYPVPPLSTSKWIPLWDTDDVDYLLPNCDATKPLRVEVQFSAYPDAAGISYIGYNRVVVDGREYVPDAYNKVSAVAARLPKHLVKITGDISSYTYRFSGGP